MTKTTHKISEWTHRQSSLKNAENKRSEKQHSHQKKTVHERINYLIDEDTFEEIDQLATSPHLDHPISGDGVLCGFATINNRRVALFAQDFSVKGGSLGQRHAEKINKVMDMAARIGCPIIGIIDSGGARIDEGIHALAGYGDIFMRNVRYSGRVPQISVVLGPCAGGAVYSPALTDFIFATENISQLFVTGPHVVREVLGATITKNELGGARVHAQQSGLVHFLYQTEEETLDGVSRLLSYLPDNYQSLPPHQEPTPPQHNPREILDIFPQHDTQSYDMQEVLNHIIDAGSWCEVQSLFAPNILIGFARIDGIVIGIIANQPQHKAGTLDIDSSCKAARFITTCNAFNIPIVSFVDVPGYLCGKEQEHNGIIRHGAKLIHAYAQATVPKITVILRKAFGGSYIVMSSKHLGADMVYAWPTAQIAVMGASGAVSILHRKTLASLDENERNAYKEKVTTQYKEEYLHPYVAAQSGYIDAVIHPESTRMHLIRALRLTEEKVEHLPTRKHGNGPL